MTTLLRTLTIVLAFFISTLPAGIAQAAEHATDNVNVSIPFADLGNVRNWHAESSEVLYVQSIHKNWFKITFWAPCLNLPFASGIAFVTDGTNNLDKYSSILVDGENCKFRTFEESAAPISESTTDAEPEQ